MFTNAKKSLIMLMLIGSMPLLSACGNSGEQNNSTTVTNVSNGQEQTATNEAETANTENSISVSDIEETPASDFDYKEEDGKIVLVRYKGSDTELRLPSVIDGKEVFAIGEDCFVNQSEITTIICPDTLTEIRKEAFINCHALSNIQLNDGLLSIGYQAFNGCDALEAITLLDTITTLEEIALGGSSLKEINIPANLEEIPAGCFVLCDFVSITIPSNIKVIGEDAFEGCYSLEEVVIEEGIEVIAEGAFESCTSLKSIVLPASVTEIGEYFIWQTSEDIVLTVPTGSYAEQYAIDNEIPYVNP